MKSGNYKTNLSGDLQYKSFCPTNLKDLEFNTFDKHITELLTKANFLLGKLNGISSSIIDMNQFIAAYVRKEALYSSQIEGTQATLEDILNAENEISINADVEEVVNYVKALNYAVKLLDTYPICNRYIRMVHEVLMSGVRGQEKNPGQFRNSQNWIGHQGSTLKNARYIPPTVEDMHECMSELEKYINEETEIDDLIKIALIHYQFETIHPFLDGNGRIGRMLIVLYLIACKKLKYPCLYISYYLKRNQFEYYSRMSDVRNKDDYIQWIEFFLIGIIEICDESIECIQRLVSLREKNKNIIKDNDYWLLEYLEMNPIIDSKRTSENLKIDYSKVNRTINRFVELGILKITDPSKRKRTYSYIEYIEILKM